MDRHKEVETGNDYKLKPDCQDNINIGALYAKNGQDQSWTRFPSFMKCGKDGWGALERTYTTTNWLHQTYAL